mgnify:CR=1 FL=1
MHKEAMFGGGCFWGVQAIFDKVAGVVFTEVGYAGGTVPHPSYEQVCSGKTGHAEVVHLRYDSQKVRYEKLLDIFFENHDPTTLDRQGPDVGHQYRSVIFTYDEAQEKTARNFIERLQQSETFQRPIVTKVQPAVEFFRAEEYHQNYLCKNR